MFDNWRHMLYIALVESILHIHQNRKALSQHKGFDYLLLGEKEKKLTFFSKKIHYHTFSYNELWQKKIQIK